MIAQPEAKIRTFLERLKAGGGNATEFFVNYSWYKGYKFSPFLFDHLDNSDPTLPNLWVFDVSKKNKPIMDKWDRILSWCGELAIIPFLRVHDFCSMKTRDQLRRYPYMTTIQHGTGQITGGLWGTKIRKYYARLNDWLIEILERRITKTRKYIIPMNEADVVRDSWSEDDANKLAVDFALWYQDDLTRRCGLPKSAVIQNPTRMFSEIERLSGCRMEVHGVGSPEAITAAWMAAKGKRRFPNGDGLDPLAQGFADYSKWKEPSAEQATEMGKFIKAAKDPFGYCYIPRLIYPKLGVTSIDKADFRVVRAIREAIGD
jgi:hypothetical protein